MSYLEDDDWEPAPGEHPTWSMEEIESHPLFMNDVPTDGDNVHVHALQSALYDYDTPEETATNFKEQGNNALKRGLVDDAGIFYEKGLTCGCNDRPLLSQLHSNLALVRLMQERFPDCVDECYRAIGHEPTNVKALYRGALASFKMDLYAQGIYFAKGGLDVDPSNSDLVEIMGQLEEARRKQAETKAKEAEAAASESKVNKLKFRWRN
jgi:hypothetical protein